MSNWFTLKRRRQRKGRAARIQAYHDLIEANRNRGFEEWKARNAAKLKAFAQEYREAMYGN